MPEYYERRKSMGNFKFDLSNEEFDFKCPECGHKIIFKGKSINHDVTCKNCHTSVHIDGKDFQKQIQKIEKQLNSLFD